MKCSAVLTKKTLSVILLVMFLSVAFAIRFSGLATIRRNGADRGDRIKFLRNLGCYVNAESETKKRITIPREFSAVYNNYNEIQKSAGYDLSLYKGAECQLFSYDVNELSDIKDPKYFKANIIVYKGRIIGGDISSVQIDGEMFPLAARDEKTKIRQVYREPA